MLVCPLRFLSVNVALSVAFDIGVLWLPTVPIVEIIFPALTVLAALLPVWLTIAAKKPCHVL